jgi:hypothetical protein
MLLVVLFMLLCLLAAAAVAAYVAFPRRGVALPLAPRAGDALARLVDSLPTVEPVGSGGRHQRD